MILLKDVFKLSCKVHFYFKQNFLRLILLKNLNDLFWLTLSCSKYLQWKHTIISKLFNRGVIYNHFETNFFWDLSGLTLCHWNIFETLIGLYQIFHFSLLAAMLHINFLIFVLLFLIRGKAKLKSQITFESTKDKTQKNFMRFRRNIEKFLKKIMKQKSTILSSTSFVNSWKLQSQIHWTHMIKTVYFQHSISV